MREMTRRDVLGLIGLGALGSLLAACSSAPAAGTAAAPTTATSGAPTSAAPAATTSAPAAASSNTTLKVLMWQGPTILNVHLAQGTKDQIASRLMCEPLITVAGDGSMSPVLATDVPSQQNGGLSADGRTVTYKLKPNVKWADG
ncbi:MAG: peptide ABC transporter substrate-binding protein, partial [Chloroflexi bacterium]|nr:peptide ABC transporter substrate-binding protein [Chloroflexota bacterium]